MPPRRRQRSGFTMLEIMVVVAIFAIVSVLVIPRMSGTFRKGELKSAARELASTLRFARHQAVVRGGGCEVRFDPEQGRFQAVAVKLGSDGLPIEDADLAEEREDGDINFDGDAARIRTLPSNVFFTVIHTTAPPSEGNKRPRVIFYPDGSATAAFIGLQSKDDKALSVEVYRTTGLSTVKPGDPVLPPDARPLYVVPGKIDYTIVK